MFRLFGSTVVNTSKSALKLKDQVLLLEVRKWKSQVSATEVEIHQALNIYKRLKLVPQNANEMNNTILNMRVRDHRSELLRQDLLEAEHLQKEFGY